MFKTKFNLRYHTSLVSKRRIKEIRKTEEVAESQSSGALGGKEKRRKAD
jgi:hypothetical protein